ncbi:TetR/AcrR family transcriptional regulator [Methylomicrobium sp. Wu6]|uniref:TetR/AcrR family transcriptional regulator n=1 Tax=Methylomicrobium sp. Wu6 TaxID=3107928 RepID=UPI002DD62F8B|nr:TetR/AcrR family transcriptional regulator [Methylomicrobium sp. Wu6]MEC4748772.1 TetR/AcrR family transcriptional regulator [Methylomicrobium sp. Wu6]
MSSNLKERILQTASELFYRQGIRATGVDAIVKAAGTTKMSLYHYFPSKHDLVLAHLQKSADAMRERILTGIAERAAEPKTNLLAVFDIFGELLTLDEFRGCPFINAATEASVDEEAFKQVSADFYRKFRLHLAELAAAAEAKQPDMLARQLVLLISGAIIAEQMQRDSGAMGVARHAAEILIGQACASAP